MKLLADENVDRPIVVWLREQGHDVVEVAAAAPGANDHDVVRMAQESDRVLMTFDRHLGWIIRAERLKLPGVIYLRLRGKGRALWEIFYNVWPRVESVAAGRFVTVRNDQVVIRNFPLE